LDVPVNPGEFIRFVLGYFGLCFIGPLH
jgi:hypothetical protein